MAATIIAMTGNPPLCFFLVLKIEKRITQWAMQGQASSKFCQRADLYALVIRSDIILHEYSLTAQPPVFSLKFTWKMALKDKRKKIKENVYVRVTNWEGTVRFSRGLICVWVDNFNANQIRWSTMFYYLHWYFMLKSKRKTSCMRNRLIWNCDI